VATTTTTLINAASSISVGTIGVIAGVSSAALIFGFAFGAYYLRRCRQHQAILKLVAARPDIQTTAELETFIKSTMNCLLTEIERTPAPNEYRTLLAVEFVAAASTAELRGHEGNTV
jgi:hypothetical protein